MILSRNMLKKVGESRHPCQTPTVVRNQSPMLLLKRMALVALLERFLMTWIRFVLMLYFFMVAHKAACQTLSKAFLKSMKTWQRSCWCWGYFSQNFFLVKDLLCGAPSCSEACLFFSDDLLRLWLQSVQYDLQYDFAWVTDLAYYSVVLALLQVAFLGKCDD